jgi:hypothetical protein
MCFVAFLLPAMDPTWPALGQLSVPTTIADPPSAEILAHLRIGPGRAARLSYRYQDQDVGRTYVDLPPRPGSPLPQAMQGLSDKRRLVVAASSDEYHPALDRAGLHRLLLTAKRVGARSSVVVIEADDTAPLDAMIAAVDVCAGLGLKAILKL